MKRINILLCTSLFVANSFAEPKGTFTYAVKDPDKDFINQSSLILGILLTILLLER